MTEDALIAVKLRLDTAAMALRSALGEAAQPVEQRDDALMEQLLDALNHVEHAQMICEQQMHIVAKETR